MQGGKVDPARVKTVCEETDFSAEEATKLAALLSRVLLIKLMECYSGRIAETGLPARAPPRPSPARRGQADEQARLTRLGNNQLQQMGRWSYLRSKRVVAARETVHAARQGLEVAAMPPGEASEQASAALRMRLASAAAREAHVNADLADQELQIAEKQAQDTAALAQTEA